MSRPEYIAALHEAKYELRFSSTERKRELLERYKRALAEAAKESNLPEALIEAAVARDFGVWMKQERLPKLSPPPRD